MIRVEATTSQQRWHLKIKDSLGDKTPHTEKIAWVKSAIEDFIADILIDVDTPSVPKIGVITLHGFEQRGVPFNRTSAVATVHFAYTTVSNVTLQMEALVPITNGTIYSPSILVYGGKKYVFCKGTIAQIVNSFKKNRPRVQNMFAPKTKVTKEQELERKMYGEPDSAKSWIDFLNERYI